jgi:hypothetical protein
VQVPVYDFGRFGGQDFTASKGGVTECAFRIQITLT